MHFYSFLKSGNGRYNPITAAFVREHDAKIIEREQ
jgi:hypothetical protein